MKISFIVTSYNIETYIDRCLRSVLEVARPGDEIIVVDDGSSDDTPAVVKACLADAPQGVEKRPVFLGQNTMGGVGIAGNIGLDMAARDGVFFVDGDDWLDVDGFNAARAAFERGDCDILIANYQEFDEANAVFKAAERMRGAGAISPGRRRGRHCNCRPWHSLPCPGANSTGGRF